MDSVIINFEKSKQEYEKNIYFQKEQLILDCKNEISQSKEKINALIIQIHELQENIDFNTKLIEKIEQQQTSKN